MQNLSKESIYRFGPFQLDSVKRTLVRDGESLPLTSKRFDILLILIRNTGRVVGKDELMRAVWPDAVVEENNLTHNVSALRKALGEKPGEHRFIVTVPGQGYQFVADISVPGGERETVLLKRTRARLVIEEDDSAGNSSDERATGGDQVLPFTGPGTSSLAAARTTTRRRSLAIGATLLAASGVAGAIYLSSGIRPLKPRPFEKVTMNRVTTGGKATGAVISPDGKYLAYVVEDVQGQSLWIRHIPTSSNVRIVPAANVQYWGITFSPDGNHIYYCTFDSTKPRDNLYRVPILGGPPTLLPVETNSPVTFSPDGRRFAYLLPGSGGETSLLIADADGTGIRTLAKSSEPDFFLPYPAGPAWSPDGKVIACSLATSDSNGLNCRLIAVRVEDGGQVPITTRYWGYIGQAAWLKDGSGIVFTANERPGSQNQLYLLSRDGETKKITNDLNDYRGVSLTSDSNSLVAVQRHVASSLRVAPADDIDSAKEIASETGALGQVSFARDGRIIYSSSASGEPALWSALPDGADKAQLPIATLSDLGFCLSPDGRHVIYTSARAGTINLWRLDAESGGSVRLTNGNAENRPQCSPDGRWVIYEQGVGNVKRTLWKAPVEGGDPVQLTDFSAIRPSISPDGKWVAFYFLDRTRENSPWRIGVISSDGGEISFKFDIPATVISRFLNWTADGLAVAYINDAGGASNVWAQPLGGGPPRQVTYFQSGRILAFDWSRDGKQFVFSHAVESSYVVLATGLRE